jgi:hypothetical protein
MKNNSIFFSQRTIRPKNKKVVLAVSDIPVIVNGCVLLNTPSKLTSTMSAVNSNENDITKPIVNKNASLAKFPSNKIIKHTILLIGDIHSIDCADMTKDNLNNINTLSSSAELMVKSLTHNDLIVFSGGTKDITPWF